MIATADIFQLSPDFHNAVVSLHNTTMPIAFVLCAAGLLMAAVRAQYERSLSSIWPELLRIFLVSMFLCNMDKVGDWVGGVVAAIEEQTGINGNPMQAFTNAIYQKFGVDLSKALGPITPGGLTGPVGNPASNGVTVSTYGFEQPGDSTYDAASAQGEGAFSFDSAPGSLVPGQSLAISPSLSAGLTPGQSVTVQLANGQTITGIYADRTADSFNGQTLYRVDIYDPNQQYGSLSGVGVTSINGNVTPQGGNLGDWFNAVIHPAETAQVAAFGMFTLALSYVAAFIMWMVSLLQSILYYSAIALGPIFVGCLVVRGLENVAKSFLLSFFAVAMWPVAFLVSGLITQLLIGMAVNSSNNTASGAANAAGATYLWMIAISLWVIASAIIGPWIVSKRFTAGATAMADMVVGTRAAAGTLYGVGYQTVSGGLNSSTGGYISPQAGSRIWISSSPNYARRPISKPETKKDA